MPSESAWLYAGDERRVRDSAVISGTAPYAEGQSEFEKLKFSVFIKS